MNKRTVGQIGVILGKVIMNFDLKNNVLSGIIKLSLDSEHCLVKSSFIAILYLKKNKRWLM